MWEVGSGNVTNRKINGNINMMNINKELRNKLFWVSLVSIIGLLMVLLRWNGRPWICECGHVRLWLGDINSSENSKHLFDPYSWTHLQHGLVFMLALSGLFRRLSIKVRLLLAMALESIWELVENSATVIKSYQSNTVSMGYTGDTIINSLGDVLMCVIGFLLASKLGWKKTIVLFVIIEVLMLMTIRDSLILNIVMPYFPIEDVLNWQRGG